MRRVIPKPDFNQQLDRAGVRKTTLARAAAISVQTIHAALNPSTGLRRRGGMYPATAWKIARAFSGLANLSAEQAFALLFTQSNMEASSAEQRWLYQKR